MLDLNDYFNPVSIEKPDFVHLTGQAVFPHNIAIHTENTPIKDISKFKIAILGVPEDRNSSNAGSEKAPGAIRGELYRLAKIPGKTKIIDLGDMKPGVTFNDTIAGLTDILSMLIQNDVFPLILGGCSTLITSFDRALSQNDIQYTLTTVDSRIDYNGEIKEKTSVNYLNNIIHNPKNTLKHYINIGYQTYLNDQQTINRFLRKKSELIRVGDIRQAIYLAEPLFRDSEVTVFNIASVRQADAPGTSHPSPNGLYGEEVCLLAKYAGISDKIKIFGLFNVNPEFDIRSQTSALAAQIIWFFLEGFAQKQYEIPSLDSSNEGRFTKYHISVSDLAEDLVFVKSNLTERWWMELALENGDNQYIACSYEDYLKAGRNEVPDRWLRNIGRIRH